jgi:molecular chaperone DnaJ
MISRDYYIVLGVPRGESQRGIRDAFRYLALRFHPDRAGAGATERFQQIVEAYQVLSDPEARRSYDRGLEHAERRTRARPPIVPSGAGAEPLVPGPLGAIQDFRVVVPTAQRVLDRIERKMSRSERLAPLDLTLVLSAEEAARGGVLRFEVPVCYPCPRCRGSRAAWPFVCARCSGHGALIEPEEVALAIPEMVTDGGVFEIPLRGLGIHNMYLRIWTRVAF